MNSFLPLSYFIFLSFSLFHLLFPSPSSLSYPSFISSSLLLPLSSLISLSFSLFHLLSSSPSPSFISYLPLLFPLSSLTFLSIFTSVAIIFLSFVHFSCFIDPSLGLLSSPPSLFPSTPPLLFFCPFSHFFPCLSSFSSPSDIPSLSNSSLPFLLFPCLSSHSSPSIPSLSLSYFSLLFLLFPVYFPTLLLLPFPLPLLFHSYFSPFSLFIFPFFSFFYPFPLPLILLFLSSPFPVIFLFFSFFYPFLIPLFLSSFFPVYLPTLLFTPSPSLIPLFLSSFSLFNSFFFSFLYPFPLPLLFLFSFPSLPCLSSFYLVLISSPSLIPFCLSSFPLFIFLFSLLLLPLSSPSLIPLKSHSISNDKPPPPPSPLPNPLASALKCYSPNAKKKCFCRASPAAANQPKPESEGGRKGGSSRILPRRVSNLAPALHFDDSRAPPFPPLALPLDWLPRLKTGCRVSRSVCVCVCLSATLSPARSAPRLAAASQGLSVCLSVCHPFPPLALPLDWLPRSSHPFPARSAPRLPRLKVCLCVCLSATFPPLALPLDWLPRLKVCLCVCLSVCHPFPRSLCPLDLAAASQGLSVCLSVCLPPFPPLALPLDWLPRLKVCLCVCLSVCHLSPLALPPRLAVSRSVCVSVCLPPFPPLCP
ncbi:hypothetical protein C7M84_021095 [Penaeus vannamei]|uniref:Uncharacterized protein n=1 Tax=Penaeus vannamei TaxID=6689 RepID=A0A3R7LRP9_PENVA|nr:hypothetical protein C7M84_021095 [Penaeus vannamei]